jgi:hypothetical protein
VEWTYYFRVTNQAILGFKLLDSGKAKSDCPWSDSREDQPLEVLSEEVH